jgi:hypothetical protein
MYAGKLRGLMLYQHISEGVLLQVKLFGRSSRELVEVFNKMRLIVKMTIVGNVSKGLLLVRDLSQGFVKTNNTAVAFRSVTHIPKKSPFKSFIILTCLIAKLLYGKRLLLRTNYVD